MNQFRISAGRTAGLSHTHNGGQSDDAYAWRTIGELKQDAVLAVADGAGSVSGTSAWGSSAAVRYVTSEEVALSLVKALECAPTNERCEIILRELFISAMHHVNYMAAMIGVKPVRLSTTLTVAVFAANKLYVAQIGDGIVAIQRNGIAETVLIENKSDASAELTSFLQSMLNLKNGWRWACYDNVTAIALSTDGLRYQATQIAENYAAHPGFFETLWNIAEHQSLSTEDLEKWLATTVAEIDPVKDDKTLLLAIRIEKEEITGGDGEKECGYGASQLPNNIEPDIKCDSPELTLQIGNDTELDALKEQIEGGNEARSND